MTTNSAKDVTTIIVKKRGRRSKKEIEEAQKLTVEKNQTNENIVIKTEEHIINSNSTIHMNLINDIIVSDNENNENNDDDNDDNDINDIVNPPADLSISDKPIAKKRGRKPKGGKIVQQVTTSNNIKETKPNVILHLKCSTKDLNNDNSIGTNLEGYSFSHPNTNLSFDALKSNNKLNELMNTHSDCENEIENIELDYDTTSKDNDIREIWKKLKTLEHNLHINNTDNKKSACFWDTCEFDNPPVFIPKHHINNSYQVYGCFCSPECATAYLMEEHIDSSAKFERYQLLNHIYSKIYNYNKNVKPAPNPYYTLEKYCGNLSIQEYRALLRNERLFLVVDKPLTRVMPELHEDNDDFIINNKIIPTNNIKMRKLQKKQTKTNILSERFGLVLN
jgi:hypothetical protein